jgi:hypothetical protein
MLHIARNLGLAMLTFACNGSDNSEVERVCEGDHFVGDAMTQAAIADCTRVTGDLILTGNELVHVELSKLGNIDGNFSVWGNPSLSDLKLSQLLRVGGYCLIESNERLTHVELPMLASVNERSVTHHADLSISGNPQLPTCQAHALRDQLRAQDFTGTIKIEDNLGTCSE